LTETTGTEVNAPATDADKPAIPEDHIALAYVLVDDTGTINDADITDLRSLGLYAFTSSAAIATIGYGPHALIDDSLLTNQREQNVTLTASSDNWIWLTRSGTLVATTTATPPEPTALLIHEATVDGVPDVTATTDRRRFIGYVPLTIFFDWQGSLSTGDYRYAVIPPHVDAIVLPINGVAFSIETNATGGTPSGDSRADVEYWNGSAWASIFDTAEDRPIIGNAEGDQIVDRAAVPAVFEIPAGSMIRANIAALPTGQSSGPDDATLTLQLGI
jgi:hypothetical protein